MGKSQKPILRSESGFAIIMVMAAIALLAYVMSDFTFEMKLNKIKVYNQQDRLQARLNAEAGLNIALAKLRLYQEARNLLEKNESAKKQINPSEIEGIVTQPFAYPIPLPGGGSLIQKSAIAEFEKNSVLQGQILVDMAVVTGFLNPNNLRVSVKKKEESSTNSNQNNNDDENKKKTPQEYIEARLLDTLKNAYESKKESDEDFDTLYGNLNLELLIKELKFFVNHPSNFNEPERGEIESLYTAKNITPKHAPLTSLDELYLLQGWPDEIVDLIKNRLTAHEVTVIPVNQLTQAQLKIIFPDITPIQSEEFFKHRDGDKELQIKPQEFKSEADFKNLITGKLAIVNKSDYDKRAKEFESAGLKIGVAGKLFRVTSTGTFQNSNYTITAYIDLPIKPIVQKKKKKDPKFPNEFDNEEFNDQNRQDKLDDDDPKKKKEKEPAQELLEPRVIEIIIS